MSIKFGTDGIRGRADVELTSNIAYKIGKSLHKIGLKTIVLGYDTRKSGKLLAESIALGAISSGINVIKVGIVPTPCIIYYSKIKKIGGVMITASHNPYYDNGIKIVRDGRKIAREDEIIIENSLVGFEDFVLSDMGHIGGESAVLDSYLNLLSQQISPCHLRIALDCANGATYKTAVELFSKVTDNLFVMGVQPNGININYNVGSTHIESLQQFALDNHCDLAFAFDGDGDRCLAIDENNQIIDGDKIIYLIGNYLNNHDLLKHQMVVLTKVANLGIINSLKRIGIEAALTDVGDKFVFEEMLTNDYSLGGENSGHVIIRNILETGDGTLTALLITQIVNSTGSTLAKLTETCEMYPTVAINLKVNDKGVINNPIIIDAIKNMQEKLGTEGKIILRASGTEDLIRLTVMAKIENAASQYCSQIAYLLGKYDAEVQV